MFWGNFGGRPCGTPPPRVGVPGVSPESGFTIKPVLKSRGGKDQSLHVILTPSYRRNPILEALPGTPLGGGPRPPRGGHFGGLGGYFGGQGGSPPLVPQNSPPKPKMSPPGRAALALPGNPERARDSRHPGNCRKGARNYHRAPNCRRAKFGAHFVLIAGGVHLRVLQ